MIQIRTDQHIFITGMTGSGKTEFAKTLYRGIPPGHCVIIDVKRELSDMGQIVHNAGAIEPVLNAGNNVVYQGYIDLDEYDQVARVVYLRGNTILWIDEAATVIPEEYPLGKWFGLLFTAGRSRRATGWSLCQRPAKMDKTAISQSSHSFVFFMNQSHDKKAVAANLPLSVEEIESTPQYHYWHYEQGMPKPQLCKPVRI